MYYHHADQEMYTVHIELLYFGHGIKELELWERCLQNKTNLLTIGPPI